MLDSGTKVRVKSKEEIIKTLDGDSKCGTIYFNDCMYAFCGQSLTLTAYFDNGSYATKESFYNWRPEWFDVIKDFEDSIWSGLLESRMLNLAMHHQVEAGNNLNLPLLRSCIVENTAFPGKEAGGFNYDCYQSEKWKLNCWFCENPPDYKWLNLKTEIFEKIIRAANSAKRLSKIIEYHDDPLSWFTWSDTIEGINYWSNFKRLFTSDSQTLTNIIQNERNKIKLQRKKTSIRVGTVPEGCRVHGKRCKTSVRSRHLSYTARIGY